MANATVEKLKTLGLRHGEKAVVGLAAVGCLFFLVTAFTRESIDLSPEQVKKSADAAATNLGRPQDPNEILKKLEDQFLKKPEFEAKVDQQANTRLVADNYKPEQLWVTNEPTGGLIREMPELIAVNELYAYPGRGGVLMFELKDGVRVPDDGKSVVDEATKSRRRKKKRGGGGAAGGSAMAMMGGAPKAKAKSKKSAAQAQAEAEAEAKKEFEELKRKRERELAGAKKGEVHEKEEDTEGKESFKETTVGKRWVVITGTFDHKKLRDNYFAALKRPEQPNYKRLDVQRQTVQSDGSWSDWEDVDFDRNLAVVDNLPEQEEELTPDNVRLIALCDPLPFLKAGYWEHVHIASLVPQEKKEIEKPAAAAGMGAPGMSGPGAGMMRSMGMPPSSAGSSSMMMSGDERMGSGMGSGMGAGAAEEATFPTSDAETLMIRSLDFTVEADASYRYRVRVVLYNPNKDREDVMPGLDNKSKSLFGPWSEPTEAVTMPPDVAPYVLHKSTVGRSDQVRFMVTRWNPEDGVTVVSQFDAGPGQVIGEGKPTRIPNSEGKEPESKKIDFNAHEIVLDTAGGPTTLPAGLSGGVPFDSPALSLLVRSDGSVVVHNQVADKQDPVRVDVEANYKKEIEETGKGKKRESSMGQGSSMSMMQQMMGGAAGNSGRAVLPGRGAGGGFR